MVSIKLHVSILEPYSVRLAGELKNFGILKIISTKKRRMDRFTQYAIGN